MRVGRLPDAGPLDRGIMLLEVLVSVMLVGIVMATFAPLLATMVRQGNLQAERQVAAAMAVEGLEQVHRQDPAGLLKGRDKESVDWSYDNLIAAGVAPYLTHMERAWDATAAPWTGFQGTTQVRTNTQSSWHNGISYNKRYYVGRCWQPVSGGPCDITPTTGVEYFRVVIRVTWYDNLCPSTLCLYVVSTLISNAPSDPVFNANSAPTVNPVADQNTPAGTPAAAVTASYTGGTAPIRWSAVGMPPGINAASNGQFSGTPTVPGTYRVTAKAIDGNGKVGTRNFTWVVS